MSHKRARHPEPRGTAEDGQTHTDTSDLHCQGRLRGHKVSQFSVGQIWLVALVIDSPDSLVLVLQEPEDQGSDCHWHPWQAQELA